MAPCLLRRLERREHGGTEGTEHCRAVGLLDCALPFSSRGGAEPRRTTRAPGDACVDADLLILILELWMERSSVLVHAPRPREQSSAARRPSADSALPNRCAPTRECKPSAWRAPDQPLRALKSPPGAPRQSVRSWRTCAPARRVALSRSLRPLGCSRARDAVRVEMTSWATSVPHWLRSHSAASATLRHAFRR